MTDNGRDAVEQWLTSALRYVELPSGTRMRIVIPNVEKMLRSGQIPSELRETATKFATVGVDLPALDDEGLESFFGLKDQMVAEMVREIYAGDVEGDVSRETEGWRPVTISAGQVKDGMADAEDLASLSAIANRRMTPNEITAISRGDAALVATVRREEAADTVEAWKPFRGERGRAHRRKDRGEVRDEAVAPAPDTRPAAELPSR